MLNREKIPKVNSLVAKPEAERAATKAEGPGMGITGIFSSTHNFACIKNPNFSLITIFVIKIFSNRLNCIFAIH